MASDTKISGMTTGAIATIGLAVIVLIGIALIAQYSIILRDETTVNATDVTLPANGSTALYGTVGQFPFLQSVINCLLSNGSGDLTASNFSITEGNADGGTITLSGDAGIFSTGDVNCTTRYLADSATQANADNFSTGLAIFGTFMSVIVLALVGKLIIGLFSKKRE